MKYTFQILLRTQRATTSIVALLLAALALTTPSHAQTFSVLYFFSGSDGRLPRGVISDWKGDLFGATMLGGASDNGTVFELTSTGIETVLYSFPGTVDTTVPNQELVRDASGNLYGTTAIDGAHKDGTIFKVTKSGESVLHTFAGGTDGSWPYAGLISDSAGNLYGTTRFGGGTGKQGTVFKLDSSGTLTLLHSFKGGIDGGNPEGGLLRDASGNLYGTTTTGGVASEECGNSGCGTVFKMNASNQLRVLHNFAGRPTDGAFAYGAHLIRDKAGNLYGVTSEGGANDFGTIFKIAPNGTATVLYNFTGGADGAAPQGGLVRDAAGNLYGTAVAGGILTGCIDSGSGCGTVFKLETSNVLTVIHSFLGDVTDGGNPQGDLAMDAAGNIYGTAIQGGPNSDGEIFKIVP